MFKPFRTSKARRRTIQGLLVGSAIALGVTGVMTQIDQGNAVKAAEAEDLAASKNDPVDPWVFDRVQSVRAALSLTNQDLASMGLGLDESKAVLSGLKSWVEQNREPLEAGDRVVYQARRELQLAQRSVRVGPRDEAVIQSIPGLESQLTNAATSLQQLYDSAGSAIEGQLTSSQLAAWNTAKANTAAGVPSRYRYASSLNDSQRAQIVEVVARRRSDVSRSRYAEADQLLSSFQNQAVAAARANHVANIEAVLQAEDAVLPQEVELYTDPSDLDEE